MRKQKAIINFKKYGDLDLASIGQGIVNKMTKNEYFPNPTPSISKVNTALKEYEKALEKCNDGNKEDTAHKNKKKEELSTELANLGNYVNSTANGDTEMLDSSGFPLSKLPEPIGILPAPSYLHVSDGPNSGELNIEVAHVSKASGYLILYSEVPAPEDLTLWHTKIFSKAKGTIINLKSGTKYAVRAATMSPEADRLGHYNYSDPVERYVQ